MTLKLNKQSTVTKLLGGLALALVVSACSGPGFVEEPTNEVQNTNLVSSLMQRGFSGGNPATSADYDQRAPLVMPNSEASTALPQPLRGEDTALASADFPVDPETVNRAIPERLDRSGEKLLPGNPQSLQMPVKQTRANTAKALQKHHDGDGRLSPAEMRAGHRNFTDIKAATAAIQASGPQDRRFLTDPPERFTTPSQNAAFALPEERRKGQKADPCKAGDLDARTYTRCQYKNN